jgi:hypothetical protein
MPNKLSEATLRRQNLVAVLLIGAPESIRPPKRIGQVDEVRQNEGRNVRS